MAGCTKKQLNRSAQQRTAAYLKTAQNRIEKLERQVAKYPSDLSAKNALMQARYDYSKARVASAVG